MHRFPNLIRYLVALAFAAGVTMAHAVPEDRTVNVNADGAELLAEVLDGVGLRRAEAIIEHRQMFGAFETLDDLIEVKGLGERTVAINAKRIRFE